MRAAVLALAIVAAGCTSGPFVADVAPRTDGSLEVRKCLSSTILGMTSTVDCKTEVVKPGTQLPPRPRR